MHERFVLFETDHLVAIALTFVVPGIFAAIVRRSRPDLDKVFRWIFVAVLIATWTAWYLLFISRGWLGLGNALPMNLCDWATIAVLWALIGPNRKAYELAYFWAWAGTTQGLFTPDVTYRFPEAQFVVFLLGHGAIIASVVYLTFGTGLRQVPASIPRVIAWTFAYGAAASLIDWMLGVNYGFFRAKPGHLTFLSYFSDWPYYIPEMLLLGVVLVFVLYLPFYAVDRLSSAGGTRTMPPQPRSAAP
jgi:hypothetical integral membrane protein (TIGR02206 family)